MAASLPPPDPPDDGGDPRFAANAFFGPATLLIAATILYIAQEIFIPLAIAGLLSFVLTPAMLWLRRHYIPRAPAALIVVLLAAAAILGFGSVVAGEMVAVLRDLPTYQYNITSKLRGLHEALPMQEIFARGTQFLEQVRGEITPANKSDGAAKGSTGSGAGKPGEATPAPVPVEIKQPSSVVDMVEYMAGPVLKPLATGGLVLVFTIFFLLYREDLRDRFIRLAGARDLHRATHMLNDAVEKLSRYLLAELAINTLYGVMMGLGTFFIGLPNAALWGVLFLVLRFVPYFGTWVAALFPLALSIAVAPGWTMFFETLGLFMTIELLVANAIEPLLFGASTGLSPVAVLVAATFWTWLWGPVGLVLSTPLTACLAVMGRYAPPLRFLVVLLGQEAPLEPEESFYQRLLAGDAAEAAEQAEAYIKTESLESFYDQVAIPALVMAQEDSERGILKRDKRGQIRDAIADMIESVEESDVAQGYGDFAVVYCLAARNELDEAAAALLAHLLFRRGLAARAASAQQWLADSRAAPIPGDTGAPSLLSLSHLGSASPSRARLIMRRLRRHTPSGTRILFGIWSPQPDAAQTIEEMETIGADAIATTLTAAAEQIAAMMLPPQLDDADESEPFSAPRAGAA